MIGENRQHIRNGECLRFVAKWILESSATDLVAAFTVILVFCLTAFAQNTSSSSASSAESFLRTSFEEELKAQAEDHAHWMYEERTGTPGEEQVKLVVETREGDIDRLRSVNGQPISTEQQKQEDRRIDHLLQKHKEDKWKHAQDADARQTEHFFKVLPDAVLASYGESKGDLVEILFKPNPKFSPTSHEDAVFHAMAGRIWINRKEGRLVEIEGHLIQDVKFADGWLGHLDAGGEFHVRQSEVVPRHWELTLLHVNMHGKVLFFKTIAEQQEEIRTNFQLVPDNMTLAEAAEQLQRRATEKSIATGLPPSSPSPLVHGMFPGTVVQSDRAKSNAMNTADAVDNVEVRSYSSLSTY
jgi:hypothetical protein